MGVPDAITNGDVIPRSLHQVVNISPLGLARCRQTVTMSTVPSLQACLNRETEARETNLGKLYLSQYSF